jgi:glucosamine--fructose-6-phosphate aminotransferase (isomerizing)
VFRSETDSEVLIHFVEDIRKINACELDIAGKLVLKIVGAYAIVIVDQKDPNLLIAARKVSPLVIGEGKQEYFIASDATPIIEYTNEMRSFISMTTK